MTARPFKTLFCERFACPLEEYEERAFRKCLYWHARFLAPMMRMIDPKFFREDFKFICHLGQSVSVTDASIDVAEYGDLNRGRPKFLRTGFKIRVSGRRAMSVAEQLLREK
jgi:hypothetical protein